MSPPAADNTDRLEKALRRVAVCAGAAAALIGGFYFLSWLSGTMTYRGLQAYTIKTNASLCLFLCGASLMLAVDPGAGKKTRVVVRTLAGLASAIGALTLFEHLSAVDLGIDQLLAREEPGALGILHPNRMGPPAALSFTLCGTAVMLLQQKKNWVLLVQTMGISICLISTIGILGHLYGVVGMYGARSSGIAWSTAASIFVLGIGLLLARPREAVMAVLTSGTPGGVVARRMLIPAIVLPVLLGWLRLLGESRGLYGHTAGTALLVLVWVVLFSTIVYQAGKQADVRLKTEEEEALRRSEQRLKSIVDNLAEGLIVIEPRNGSLQWNRKALEMYQMDARAEGLDLLDGLRYRYEVRTLEGELVPLEQVPMARILRGEEFHDLDLSISDLRDNWERIFAFSGILIRDPAGEPQVGLLHFRDITDRKEAENALRESEEKFRAVVQQAAVGMGRVRFDDARWVDVNEAFCNMLGYSRKEMLSTPWPEMTHPEDLDLDLIPFKKMAAGELASYTVEKRFIHKEGRHVWARLTLSLVRDPQGRPDYEIAIVEDITDRKQAEEALRKAKDELELRVRERTRELEEAYSALKRETEQRLAAVEDLREKEQLLVQQSRMAAMGEMLGNIAHQWRQPLNVLGLLIQSLRFIQQKGLLTEATLAEEIAKGMKMIQHMSQTIDDFKDFLKEEKESKEFSLNSAITATIALLEAPLKSANVVVELDEGVQLSVVGHRNEFSHVILNLVNNARDALKEKEISDAKIVIRLFKEGEKSVVTVADNAGGIPEEIIGRIFDPYFTTKGAEKGTGIGLYMSKNIIEKKMHGRLSVRNIGEGAEFRIEL